MRAKYVLSEVMTGLWRNVTMTIAMIITMAVSLTMLGASLVMYHQIDKMKATFINNVEVSIFVSNDASTDQIAAIGSALKSDALIKSVQFENHEQAYEKFKQMAASQPNLVAVTTPANLPQSYRVKLKDPTKFSEINNKYKDMAGVGNVVDQASLLDKVFKVLGALQNLALVLAVAQGLAALLLVANTIQVAAYSKRREVAVMKLVGASNWFIQSPFVLEAMFAGMIGALIAFGGLVAGKIFLVDRSLKALSALLGKIEWTTIFWQLPLLLAAGALVSGVTGWVTLRAYIRK